MREIKFRVWDGAKIVSDVIVGRFGVFYVNPTNNGLDENDSASLTPFNTKYHDNTPVMQYTGLKDKNGKEIYEGDIVSWKASPMYGNSRIAFYDGGFHLADYPITNYTQLQTGERVEIIGNIYENTELLNK